MTKYSIEERRHAREVLGLTEDGRHIPLCDRTKEALIETMALQRAKHHDELTGRDGAIDALKARLRAHRKAKALANQRADKAVAAMKAMLDSFEKGGTD